MIAFLVTVQTFQLSDSYLISLTLVRQPRLQYLLTVMAQLKSQNPDQIPESAAPMADFPQQ